MATRRIPKRARDLLVRMLASSRSSTPHSLGMDELVKRGLVRRSGAVITAESARVVYQLTDRGVQVGLQLSQNKVGRDLRWDA